MCDCLDVCTCHVQTQGGPVSGRQHRRDTELDIMAGRLGPALGSESETQNQSPRRARASLSGAVMTCTPLVCG